MKMTEQNNDYGKSKADAMRAINNADFNARLKEAKQAELSPLETAEKMFSGMDMQTFGKTIKIIAAAQHFYHYLKNEDKRTWKMFNGYALLIQGYIDHPLADEYIEFQSKAETLYDVLMKVLESENVTLDVFLKHVPNLDKDWFLVNLKEQTILKFLNIAGNKEEYDILYKQSVKEMEESKKRLEEKEALHKTLMKD
jgi:hypothetical protein